MTEKAWKNGFCWSGEENLTDRDLMQMALEELEDLVESGHSGSIIVVNLLRDRLAQEKPWVKTYSDDMEKIKAYTAVKMKHIKMYNECMNLADGLDVEKFAELVRADERGACAKLCDGWSKRNDDVGAFIGQAIRARSEK